jgi:hypothetical protein
MQDKKKRASGKGKGKGTNKSAAAAAYEDGCAEAELGLPANGTGSGAAAANVAKKGLKKGVQGVWGCAIIYFSVQKSGKTIFSLPNIAYSNIRNNTAVLVQC